MMLLVVGFPSGDTVRLVHTTSVFDCKRLTNYTCSWNSKKQHETEAEPRYYD